MNGTNIWFDNILANSTAINVPYGTNWVQNTDGFDTMDANNIKLTNFWYQGGDDCIAIKPRSYNIWAQNVPNPLLLARFSIYSLCHSPPTKHHTTNRGVLDNMPRRQRNSNRFPRPIPRRRIRNKHHGKRCQHPHLQFRHAQQRIHQNMDRRTSSPIRIRERRITPRRRLVCFPPFTPQPQSPLPLPLTWTNRGNLTNLLFENFHIEGAALAAGISQDSGNNGSYTGTSKFLLSDITFRNFTGFLAGAKGTRTASVSCSNVHPCFGIAFDNFRVAYAENVTAANATGSCSMIQKGGVEGMLGSGCS